MELLNKCKDDVDGNVIGMAHENWIVYKVEFPHGEVTELTAKIIAEYINAQFEADGYTHLYIGLDYWF